MTTEEIVSFGDIKGIKVGGSIIGMPLMRVFFYHLDSILIDTGPYCSRRSIENYLEQHDIDRALLTHYHEDHAGNARYLTNRGIQVFGHEKTVSLLNKKHLLKPYEHILFGKLESAKIESLPDIIHTANYELIPVHTPGHSCDHMAYYEPNRGWLFSGDLFLGSRIKYWRKDEDMSAMLQSLDSVLKLDFERLFCGHNPKLKKPKKYIESKRQQLLELIDRVSDLMRSGLQRKEILKQLTEGKETRFAKWLTLGDASYKNMVAAAIDVAMKDRDSP
ncbi:MAG: MBL fold metallo-hydrolase [Candidatus Thiodiazotropha sp.]|jgi:glyoxylase-like metal-dependent hydrolase (beta-lactamase superfamily II)